ncbi:DUF1405 domain-containing protein [Bacillus sp. FJAT-50079]|uniref:DUF1405 domain-containing protein n=1 Tax=Bacillus sp. FJAT-50079 TaxID=2833577 RepID=UPI001BCA3FF3|nr:DUF1405 domain-containing protein [Bacillus sp. FJAT-50079]MBS4209777.1 DUF1405 domain-containing protein [Bacillus sp. FJAT-50079]
MNHIYTILTNRLFLWLLLIVNTAGTIYGYIWYEGQLELTPTYFLPFVPDSPTASLFFCFVLLAFLLKKNWGLAEALALITLFKYGIWAVVMNILTLNVTGYLPWQGYMLIASHGAMAIQAILYAPYYRMKTWHIAAAAIWTLHNDVIDYVFMQYPIYPGLELYIAEIGYFTFWLSIVAIAIAYYFSKRNQTEGKYMF